MFFEGHFSRPALRAYLVHFAIAMRLLWVSQTAGVDDWLGAVERRASPHTASLRVRLRPSTALCNHLGRPSFSAKQRPAAASLLRCPPRPDELACAAGLPLCSTLPSRTALAADSGDALCRRRGIQGCLPFVCHARPTWHLLTLS
jgi:hypothetical protein